MFKKYRLITYTFLISFALAFTQISLISSWPEVFNKLNILLIVLVFSLFFFGRLSSLYFSLFFGFFLDIFSFHWFGLYLITFFLTTFFSYQILKNLLTNRSLYSFLALMLLTNFIYNFVFYFLIYLSSLGRGTLFIIHKTFWLSLVWQLLWSIIAALLLFHAIMVISKKVKPFFLEKK